MPNKFPTIILESKNKHLQIKNQQVQNLNYLVEKL